MTQKRKLIIIALMMILSAAILIAPRLLNHSCCAAQEGEEGNPGHKQPTAQCAHRPKPGQVGCRCMRNCDPDNPQEDRRCKSYCFKWFCTCPPCA